MPRRFNYTGRQKIAGSNARFRLLGEGDTLRFDAELTLSSYKLDPTGRIFVEAYRGTTASWKRFAFGTVQSPVVPVAGPLAEFNDADGIQFRVKVTSAPDENGVGGGRLLAKADQIKPTQPGDDRDPARSLLVTEARPLGGEAWKIDLAHVTPTLVIDPAIGGKAFARHPAFRALVAPAIVRQILTEYCQLDDTEPDDDDPESYRSRWIAFAERLAGKRCPFGERREDDRREWVDDACRQFALGKKLVDDFVRHLATENAS